MKTGELGEFELIEALTRGVADGGPDVVCGVGDDAAVLRAGGGRLLLTTCDAQIEDVHFARGAISPEQLGRRLVQVNLSDVAAMGGKPRFALASLAAPADCDTGWLERVFDGLAAALEAAGATLVGGNTARLPERTALHLFLIGEVEEQRLLRRSGARPGDLLCVTGALGGPAAGLLLLEDESIACEPRARERALERHLRPTARLAAGRVLGKAAGARSCIDVSDGLVADARHLAASSGVAISIDAGAVPLAECASAVALASGRDPLELALGGGEEYELLFTVDPAAAEQLLDDLLEHAATNATVIGAVAPGSGEVTVLRDGRPLAIRADGFDHFG
jgi:thiamine-monophosphate kinase